MKSQICAEEAVTRMRQDIYKILFRDSIAQEIRLRITRPANETPDERGCILINSGRVARFDDNKYEAKLFAQLHQLLAREGISTFEIDFALRDIGQFGPSDEEIEQRLTRLHCILNHYTFAPFHHDYSIVGLSLGGQVALRFVADCTAQYPDPKQLVLISTVVEHPTSIFANVEKIHLVYGGNDFVGYIAPEQEKIEMLSPDEYSQSSIANLVVRRSQIVLSHIIPGCGHVLAPVDIGGDDPMAYLLNLLVPTNPATTTQSTL